MDHCRGRGPNRYACSMVTPDGSAPAKGARSGSLVRDLLVILVAGAALGVGYNVMIGLGSTAKALPWIRTEPKLASLEELTAALPPAAVAPDSAAPSAVSAPLAAPAVTPAASATSAPERTAPAAATTTRSSAATRQAEPPVTAPAQTPAAATPAVVPPVPGGAGATVSAPAVALPVVPETREPLEVGIDFTRRFHTARGAVFVDARTAEEFAAGHIPGATNLPFDDVFKNPELARAFADRGLPVVVYCGGGDCELARSLAFSLIDAGHKRVLVFKDGLPGWTAAGLPVTTGVNP